MTRRRFRQIDVFSTIPLSGNPVAVVLDSEGLSTTDMQRLTRWLNLSETAFLLPPLSNEADYRVRIFTLTHELAFAGHPTLGSCGAWLNAAGRERDRGPFIQECGAGLVRIRRLDDGGLAFEAPPLVRSGEVEEMFLQEVASVLGLHTEQIVASQWVDNGPGWVGILLEDAETVLSLEPDFGRYSGSGNLDIGVIGPYRQPSECAFEVRAFFNDAQGVMREDPATGSLNASLGQWLFETGRAKAPYAASQGTRMGRRGRIWVDRDQTGKVWVGGGVIECIHGHIEI